MIADIITSLRIVFSICIVFMPVFSPLFYVFYSGAGITDMVDGTVARVMGTAGERGARLDTAADMVFTCICLIKIIPEISLPGWCYIAVVIIALIKLFTMLRVRKLVAVHSVLNKITGVLLFLFPMTVGLIDVTVSAAVISVIAFAAALHESYSVIHGHDVVKV
ncbi:MAG: CDP-alcohol phosphatidyltransferase family protein [Bullifex sp.]